MAQKQAWSIKNYGYVGDVSIMMKKLLPRDNELPASTYEAKKLVCPLGLDMQKIHACPTDCILYHGEEYDNLDAFPVCTHCGIRSDGMTLVMLRASHPGRGFLPR
jgi:hypothetical protein